MATASSPIVLVTGVNGFVASTAVLEFLAAGYRVRGTVRSLAKSLSSLAEAFQPHLDAHTLELVEVPDFLAPGAFDVAAKGVVGVAHIAAPGMRTEDLADPALAVQRARDGMTSILRSVEAHAGPQLQSFVLLSSLAAMMRMSDPPGYRYTGDEFNTEYLDMALGLGEKSPKGLTYAAVKVAIEQAFWGFVKNPERSSTFAGVAVNPSFIMGPVVVRPEEPTSLPASVRCIWHVFGGGAWPADFQTPAFVDVRDVGRAAVFGVQDGGKVNGQRLLLSAYKGSLQAVATILREEFPERRDAIRAGNPGERSPDDVSWGEEEVGADGSRFERLSGRPYYSYRDSVVAAAKSMEPYLAAGKDKQLGDEVPILF